MSKCKFFQGRVLHIILIVWLVFATLYVVYGEYNRLSNVVYKAGVSSAVSQVIVESQKCQPVPLNVNGMSAQIINLECLQQPAVEEEAPVE